MKNSYENLPKEYENDRNTYCHGVVNCKYYHGECIFMDMGSGNPDDMPCRVQAEEDIKAFNDFNDGIVDATYINGIIDCSDLDIFPWGNS